MKTIGNRVRDLRKAKGFARQGDLGRLVGVDQSVISDIENGAGFKADVLMALCEHLDTTAEYLMLGDQRTSQGEAEILSLYRKTSDEGRNAMIVMARGLRASYPRMGNIPTFTEGLGESPAVETLQPDTLITNHPKQVELSIPGTSTKKGAPQSDKRSTDTEPKSSKRGKHAKAPAQTRRTGRA
jgi:transcriptional regulator with XRE-family HTH domain